MCSLRNQEDIEWGVQQTGENLGFQGRICVVDADLGERLREWRGRAENRPWGRPSLHSEWKKAAPARDQGSRAHRRPSSERKGEIRPQQIHFLTANPKQMFLELFFEKYIHNMAH